MAAKYAGRDASASPRRGLAKRHAAEQAALIAAALGIAAPQSPTRRNKEQEWPLTSKSPRSGVNHSKERSPNAETAGEAVAEDEPIASLETDKVTVEVPSPVGGMLTEQLVKEGETVAVGALIARIDAGATAAVSAPAQAAPMRRPIPRDRARLRRCAATTMRQKSPTPTARRRTQAS